MTRFLRILLGTRSLTLALAAAGIATTAGAMEVLVNGNLEASVAPPSWTLDQTITGQAGTVNATEQISFADQSGTGLGLFLRPFAGNGGDFAGLNLQTNAVLSQTIGGFAGRTYTFTGGSRFDGDGDPGTDDGYSGGVATLDINSPSGAVPSPTTTTFSIEFLNAASTVLSTVSRELRTDFMQLNEPIWQNHSLSGVAPAGTNRVRVTAAARNMVENTGGQNVYWDDFSLRDNVVPGNERLVNGNLNLVGPPTGYTLTELPAGTDNASFRDFANHTTGGQQGLWIRAFEGGETVLAQDVPAVAGANYAFTAWSKWEVGYAGGLGDPTVVTSQKLEFLDGAGMPVGTPQVLNLATAGQMNDGTWRQYTLNAAAPAGATSVRVSVGASGMYNSGFDPQSAFFDDLSLIQTLPAVQGDYNSDGVVNAADYTAWRDLLGTAGPLPNEVATPGSVTPEDYTFWVSRYGATSASGTAIPEPAAALVALAATFVAGPRRRRAA
ncbi:MAG: hypothetical protein ACRCT8_02110 [Lacipirellulaceae bacterium]